MPTHRGQFAQTAGIEVAHLPGKILAWAFLLSFFVKAASVWVLSSLTHASSPGLAVGWLAVASGDAWSYIDPIENWLTRGSYYWHNGVENVYAGRMPYYGLFYLLPRLVLSQAAAADVLVFVQVVGEAAVPLLVAIGARHYSAAPGAPIVAYALSLLAMHSTALAHNLIPDSLATVFMAGGLVGAIEMLGAAPTRRRALDSGLALAFSSLMRPAHVLVFIAPGIALLRSRLTPRAKVVMMALFLGPLPMLLLPWIVRNALVYNRFIPTQIDTYAGYGYDEANLAWRRYLAAWGGSTVFWDHKSAGCYFILTDYPCRFTLGKQALSASVTRERVEAVRLIFYRAQRTRSAEDIREAATSLSGLALDYRHERPFSYFVVAPFRLGSEMLFNSGSYFVPHPGKGPITLAAYWAIKALQSGLYYLALASGVMATVIALVRKSRRGKTLVLVSPALAIVLLHCVVLRRVEWRYVIPALPGLFVLGADLVAEALGRLAAMRGGARR